MTIDLSVIILSYNTKKITFDCLTMLIKSLATEKDLRTEVIVLDNASKDGSAQMLKEFTQNIFPQNVIFQAILNKKNVGYSKGNNQALKIAKGKYILFLNSDAIVKKINFSDLIDYFDKNPKVGVITVKILLPSGNIDPATHRGFPTAWNSFCYFLGFEKIFGKIPILGKIFGGYHLTYLDLKNEHEIDSSSGTFYLSRKSILDKLAGFDENFFMYGEDLDLSMRIRKLGYRAFYYPKYEVLHLKYQSGLKNKDPEVKKKVRKHFFESMRIFYRKHYEKQNPAFINFLVYFFIDIKKKLS